MDCSATWHKVSLLDLRLIFRSVYENYDSPHILDEYQEYLYEWAIISYHSHIVCLLKPFRGKF